MRRCALFLLLLMLALPGFSQNQKVKNVILLIPDGTSLDVLALSRWFSGNKPLAVDEIISGLSKTYSADSTIADSAPAGTALATGTKSITGFVGVDRDSLPHISVLELARLKGKSTGVVVTCEFPHATPADFVCHYPSRSYSGSDVLIRQFIYNSPSLVFAGGAYYLENYLRKPYSLKDTLKSRGFSLITDLNSFNRNTKENVWALFSDWENRTRYLSHDADRNPKAEPSLSEMTAKAIEILSKNPEGFFLMVEGSQVDWAAHSNEPYALITDFLAFDKAVAVALEFAKSDDSTLVVVCPDHGNGGISIGNKQSGYSPTGPFAKIEYDNLNIAKSVISPLDSIVWTGRKLARKLITDSLQYFTTRAYNLADTLKAKYNLTPLPGSLPEIESIVRSRTMTDDKKRDKLENLLGTLYSEQHFIGWTTSGHTAEDVFLGVYAPAGIPRLTGVVENTDVAEYIAGVSGLGDLQADSIYFNRVNVNSREFANYPEPRLDGNDLVFDHKSKDARKRITIPANVDYYLIGNKRIESKTLLVNIKDDYYVPLEIIHTLKSNH